MILFYHILFIIGLIFYGVSLFFMNSVTGETLSDVANAVMLIDAVLILLYMVRKKRK